MFINRKQTLLLCGLLLISATRTGLAARVIDNGTVSNSYLFIENNVDNEYFITPSATDPRFSGANVWTKYKTNQDSLGYMGNSGWSRANTWFDMWLEDSPINNPFLGIRCRVAGGSACPSTGYRQAEYTDNEGFYHTRSGYNIYDGAFSLATLSNAAYDYFKNQSAGAQDNLKLNLCYHDASYDYAAGERCKTLNNGVWYKLKFNVTKLGHLTLRSTGALAEVWTASDGTPSVTVGSDTCSTGVVSGTRGLICKMVAYSLQESQKLSSLQMQMVIDTGKIGFSPGGTEIRYSGNGSSWVNYNAWSPYSNTFKPGGDYVHVFMADSFFKKLLDKGVSITGNDDVFTFSFRNSVVPESGFYQFTASTTLDVLPEEYGISIISADEQANPKRSGTIGDPQPIEFDYRVTTSASRQADSITVQVTGDHTTLDGIPYCVFSSADNSLKVPIPAYVSFTNPSGTSVSKRNSCAEAPIDITQANWVQTALDASVDDSYFYQTNLTLSFPMNDSRSQFTVAGEEWMGAVSASGEIRATATWVGVDR